MLDFLKQYGPAIIAIFVAYYRDKAMDARHQQKIAELELKIEKNHEKVERDNAGKSDSNIVDDAANWSDPDFG